MGQFAAAATARWGRRFDDYKALWDWSVAEPNQFWRTIVEFFDVGISPVPEVLVEGAGRDAHWMRASSCNYARDALRHEGDQIAVEGVSQTRPSVTYSRNELREQVARCCAGLKQLGVKQGDSVVAYLPNIPETVALLLACAALGAPFASCPPEFGTDAVVQRFTQLNPKVLVAADGYVYAGKHINRSAALHGVVAGLPTLEAVVELDYDTARSHSSLGASDLPVTNWDQLLSAYEPLTYADVPFNHPLYVLFSSGSTGRPKALVLSHGGILLEHNKAMGLHNDLAPGDTFFWFSTTGWMVWNYAVSALLHAAKMVCFDGDPLYPDPLELWRVADQTGTSYFGTSASHIMLCARSGIRPRDSFEYRSLRAIGSTGSPLPGSGFEWLDESVSSTAALASISGGTEICSGFLGGAPLLPTRAGEIAGPMLGCDVAAIDLDGTVRIGEYAELCVRNSLPSMPVAVVGDHDGSIYADTYYPGGSEIWHHRDWILIYPDGASVIAGRSDATLNRGGVRLGTAEIYNVIDTVADVADSLVVHVEGEQGSSGTLYLLLALAHTTDARVQSVPDEIKMLLRERLSPRHVPDRIVILPELPRTLTGKRMEVPVKRLLLGADPSDVTSSSAVNSVSALDAVAAWAQSERDAAPAHHS